MKRSRVGSEAKATSVLQSILGETASPIALPLFISQNVPALSEFTLSSAVENENISKLLNRTVIAPMDTFNRLEKVNLSVCQSLESLVDEVVWSLVQRRQRHRRKGTDARNVLCLGYSVPSEKNTLSGIQTSRSMPAGVAMQQLNSNVDYCKTNPSIQILHQLVGDDVMRELLLNTSIFIPLASSLESNNFSRGNFLQLSGPPVKGGLIQEYSRPTKRRRRRKRGDMGIQVPANLDPSHSVSRRGIFYADSFSPVVGLGSEHILNRHVKPQILLEHMFGRLWTKGKQFRSILSLVAPILGEIVSRQARYPYQRMLQRYCPLPDICKEPRGSVNIDLGQVAKSFQTHSQVVSFLKSVVTNVFPLPFWGSQDNLNAFLTKMELFVNLRKKERLTNQILLEHLKVKKVKWLYDIKDRHCRSDHRRLELIFLSVLRWLLEDFLVNLVRSSFYVTESEFSSKQLLFYRKPTWAIFRTMSHEKLLESQYKEISRAEALSRLKEQEMGFSRLRLVPKETGVRPIAMLCKREDIEMSHELDKRPRRTSEVGPASIPTNTILGDTFAVLRDEYDRNNALFGAGVQGLHLFYPKYRTFIKSSRSSSSGLPLLFGSVDIRKCYDNIDQRVALDIVSGLLTREDYMVRRYSILHACKGIGRVVKRQLKDVNRPICFEAFHQSATNMATSHHGTLFSDGVGVALLSKAELLKRLEEHLTCHLVVIKGRYTDRYLVQSTGIPQGSVVSSTLCNFYFGHVEQELLRPLLTCAKDRKRRPEASVNGCERNLLSRMVDDYFLISTSESEMKQFLSTMLTGRPALGVTVNAEKTRVSSTIDLCDVGHGEIQADMNSGGKFPWCGMLFDTSTGEVSIEYARFYDGAVSDGLTVDGVLKRGLHFGVQLRTFYRPRCLPILFDCEVNSKQVQFVNFYHASVLAATKTIAYISLSSIRHNLMANAVFLLDSFDETFRYAFSLITQRLKSHNAATSLTWQTTRWLGWRAFRDVFNHHGAQEELAIACYERYSKVPNSGDLKALAVQAFHQIDVNRLMVGVLTDTHSCVGSL